MEIQKIAEKYDIRDKIAFSQAMNEMKDVSNFEIFFALSYDLSGQSRATRNRHALAKAELSNREFLEQKKLTKISAYSGLAGVVIGAILQILINNFF